MRDGSLSNISAPNYGSPLPQRWRTDDTMQVVKIQSDLRPVIRSRLLLRDLRLNTIAHRAELESLRRSALNPPPCAISLSNDRKTST